MPLLLTIIVGGSNESLNAVVMHCEYVLFMRISLVEIKKGGETELLGLSVKGYSLRHILYLLVKLYM